MSTCTSSRAGGPTATSCRGSGTLACCRNCSGTPTGHSRPPGRDAQDGRAGRLRVDPGRRGGPPLLRGCALAPATGAGRARHLALPQRRPRAVVPRPRRERALAHPELSSGVGALCWLPCASPDGRVRAALRRLRGADQGLLVAVRLAPLGLLDQRGGWLEALAVGGGEVARAGHESGQAALVAVDVLQDAAGPAREADPEDRPDV